LHRDISAIYSTGMDINNPKHPSDLKPFLVRLRPFTRQLLDDAAAAERRSRASIIDEALRAYLADYESMHNRLDQMLGQAKP
jgi:hypothetical protein